jgi:carboxymethylenebutenolidase
MWGELLAGAGYFALMVDGFGPRGYPQGFPRHSYDSRPAELDEVTVRPLDAYGAAAYLRTRPEIGGGRIGLIGWSNGGSATLAAMASGITAHAPETGFSAALVFYAGCKLKDRFEQDGYKPYAPVHVFHGTADEETSSRRCAELVESSRAQGGDIAITLYPDATHGFDDPGEKRQRVEANAAASDDAIKRGLRFFARHLR